MKRINSTAVAAVIGLIVFGLARPMPAGEQVPFKGEFEGEWSRTPLEAPFVFDEYLIEGCATHLGEFELLIEATVNLATRSGSSSLTFVAANGDMLTAEGSGMGTPTGTPGVVMIVQNATITGGTGRFSNASGSFTTELLLNAGAGMTVGSFDGTISHP